jgi:hypothetical protein
MPRPEKGSPEAKAWGEKMKASRAAKKDTKVEKEIPTTTSHTDEDLLTLIKNNQEVLMAVLAKTTPGLPGSTVTDKGIEGTREKYDSDPTKYPDYTDRLAKETRLVRFGFKENYRLMYDVKLSRYQRADGVWEQQPRFIYQLWGKRIDPDTGEFVVNTDPKTGVKTESIYGINQYIFHEDPEYFMIVARDEGLDVTDDNLDAALDEARYIQVRDWLLGCFYPEAARPSENRTELVIGNKLVEVKEVSVEDGERVKFDFSDMKKL